MFEIKLDTLFVLGDISQDIDEVYEFAYYNRVKDEFDILLTHIALKESSDFSQFRVEVCTANRAIEINKNQVHINGHDHQEKLTGGQEATGFKRDVHTIIY